MTNAILSRPFAAFATFLRPTNRNAPAPKGKMPKWIDDPALSEQLLNDTGLSPEDLGGRSSYDPKLPFFMQQGF